MKLSTIILLVIFFGISSSAKSQFTKGEKLIGGNANINFTDVKSENLNNPTYKNHFFNINILPRFSWVTRQNQLMGVVVGSGYSYAKSFNEGSKDFQTTNNFTLTAGYFFRHYSAFAKQCGWFMEYNLNGVYGQTVNKVISAGVNNKYKWKNYGANIVVYPGFYYKMSQRTLIEASFGGLYANYTRSKDETAGKSRQIILGANFPTNFSLGVQFVIGNKL